MFISENTAVEASIFPSRIPEPSCPAGPVGPSLPSFPLLPIGPVGPVGPVWPPSNPDAVKLSTTKFVKYPVTPEKYSVVKYWKLPVVPLVIGKLTANPSSTVIILPEVSFTSIVIANGLVALGLGAIKYVGCEPFSDKKSLFWLMTTLRKSWIPFPSGFITIFLGSVEAGLREPNDNEWSNKSPFVIIVPSLPGAPVGPV